MDIERARRAHSIFTAALERPKGEREALVSEACGGDEVLASRVRKLLEVSERGSDFLEAPVMARRSETWARVPDAVGDYLVIGVLGSGGMATVYEAVQENPHRRVALKVMHGGMSHTDAFLRFRLEAQTLAQLQHPGIAQIYEAGSAQLGEPAPSPFFAMELIKDALPLTEYARRHALTLRERLTMFATVCDAVVHGHQHGIIHRDLKPANVLVGADGLAKVIDFGIARTTAAAAAGASSLTMHSDARKLIGTLNYMSPEQCERPESIDVRADVYSLGVMLYELVTGRLPHDLASCSLPEAARIITQDEPPPASTISNEAAGDLDAIIAKAMDKDPERRYAGAGALAADLRRWLDHRPIEARPASAWVHARKFVRRNRWLAASIAALAVSLVAGTAVSAWLAYKAGLARDAALEREQELAIAFDFQESLLRDIDVPAMGELLRNALMERIERAARSEPAPEAPSDAEAARRLVGRVNFTSLAVRILQDGMLRRYGDSIDEQFAEKPTLRARLMQQLASTMNTLGLPADAEPLLRKTLEIRRAALGDDHEDTLLTLHSLGSLLSTLGRYDEALTHLLEAHERRTRTLGPEHHATLQTGSSLGGLYRRRGELQQAERVWGEVLSTRRRIFGDDHPETLRSLSNMGVVYATQDRLDEAEACWRELLERRRRVLGEHHPDYLGSLGNFGALLQSQGRLAEARPLLEQALAANRQHWGDTHNSTLVTMAQLATVLQEAGDLDAAEGLWRECLQGRSATLGPESPDAMRAEGSLAFIMHLRGRSAEAAELLSKTLQAQRRLLGDDHPDVADTTRALKAITAALDEADPDPGSGPASSPDPTGAL